MAIYTNTQRMTGLSGIDTESMITQLMKAESQKLHKLQKNSTKITWKQEAYWTVRDSLSSFQSKYLSLSSSSSLRMPSTWGKYNTSVQLSGADSKAVTVTGSGSNASGSYSLKVLELAAKDTYKTKTGSDGVALDRGSITSEIKNTDIAELSENGGSFWMTLDGTSKEIKFAAGDIASNASAGDLATLIQGKANAAFGAGKVTISATVNKLSMMPTDKGHTLTITEGTAMAQTDEADTAFTTSLDDLKTLLTDENNKQSIKFKVGEKETEVTFDFSKFDWDAEGMSVDKVIAEMNSQVSAKGVSASFSLDSGKISLKTTGLSRDKMTITNGTGTMMNTLGYTDGKAELGRTSTLSMMNITGGATNQMTSAGNTLKNVLGDSFFTTPVTVDGESKTGYYEMMINDKTILLHEDDSVDKFMEKINSSGANVKISYDGLTEAFTLESTKEGAINNIDLGATGSNARKVFEKLGFEMDDTARASAGMVGKDSTVIINGVTTTRESNTFSYNGVTFKLNETTLKEGGNAANPNDYDELKIEVERNTTAIKDILTDFVSAYNDLISGVNGMVNEKRAKSSGSYYEPLTDEEKKAMSEDEIKSWESKAKEGILNRDSILSGITADMRSWLYESVTMSDGSKLALYQIGITTSESYSDQGKLVIDEDALNAAIEKYGEKIGELFTNSPDDSSLKGSARQSASGLAYRLNNIIDGAIGSNGSISNKAGAKSGYTQFDNDLYNQLKTENQKITDMLAYLAEKETYYYNMFSKLEAAISSNDSQMSYLQQMFGM